MYRSMLTLIEELGINGGQSVGLVNMESEGVFGDYYDMKLSVADPKATEPEGGGPIEYEGTFDGPFNDSQGVVMNQSIPGESQPMWQPVVRGDGDCEDARKYGRETETANEETSSDSEEEHGAINILYESEVLGPAAVQWQNSDEKLLGSGRGRGGFRGRRKRGNEGRGMMGRPQTVFNRGRDYAPSRLRTHLVFDLRFTAPAASVMSPWSLNVILATNPNTFTLASTPVPGYTELAGLYRKYRVRSFKLIYSVINYELYGIEAFICPVNFLPSTALDPTRYLSQGVATRRIVSAKGGKDNATLFKSSSITSFGGSANTTVEDAYVGTTDNSSPPSDNIYFIYGFMTNGAATVSPSTNIINLKVLIDFFELQSPAT
jgi:hypothetical protein